MKIEVLFFKFVTQFQLTAEHPGGGNFLQVKYFLILSYFFDRTESTRRAVTWICAPGVKYTSSSSIYIIRYAKTDKLVAKNSLTSEPESAVILIWKPNPYVKDASIYLFPKD